MFLDVLDGSWCFLVFLEVSWISPHNATWHGIAWQHYATTCSNKLLISMGKHIGQNTIARPTQDSCLGPWGLTFAPNGENSASHNMSQRWGIRPTEPTHTHTRAVVHATRDFQILLEWNGRSLAKSSLANKIQNLIAGTSSQKQAALWKPRVNRARWKGTYKEHPPPANFNSTLSSSLKRYNWKRAFFYRWHLWTIQIQGLTYVLHV